MARSNKSAGKKKTDINNFGESIKIGASPIPGLTLRYVLRGHTGVITRMAWSPDGKYLASPSADNTIRIWDMSNVECIAILIGHAAAVSCVAWAPDGQMLASGSTDNTIRIWNVCTWEPLIVLQGNNRNILCLAWSPKTMVLFSGSADGTICQWDAKTWYVFNKIREHKASVWNVLWAPDEKCFATAADDRSIYFWDQNAKLYSSMSKENMDWIWSVAWLPNSKLIASTCKSEINIWDINYSFPIKKLEGHNGVVKSLSVSSNGSLLASKGEDGFRLWRTDVWETVGIVKELTLWDAEWFGPSIAFHPSTPILATLGENDTIIRIWELDEALLLAQAKENINYTTAKLVLVGDSGVGKTGLGWRLAHNEFKEHASTHGQQFWPVSQLNLKRKDGTDCEAVLWDLAGQHVYRQVHSIFLVPRCFKWVTG